MKKLFRILLSAWLGMDMPLTVLAEGEDSGDPDHPYSDTEYWGDLCTSSGSEHQTACAAYLQYQSEHSSELSDRIKEIESQRAEIAENITYYASLVQDYQNQADALNDDIATLNKQIADMNGQIAVKEAEIEKLEAEIEANQEEIDQAESKIKERMAYQQQTMRLNQYLDVLMGAKTFDELVRIANGLSAITEYDNKTMEDLADQIDQLNTDKAQLDSDKADLEQQKADLDAAKQEVVNKQNQILTLKYQAQVVEEEYQQQSADLEAEGNRIAADIEAIRAQMAEISQALSEVAASAGWTYPVPGVSINPNAGTWHYASGGVHLGADFSGALGSSVVAVGNGVVINSANGCGYGNLGNGCGSQYGGSWGGGNQVYLLTKVNGNLYAIKYLHLLAGSPLAKGTIVTAGQQIGLLGSSGNSTGPHCHIEVFYLGSADQFASYAQNWNGDLAFGCGWGTAALNRLCENGVGAPCRVKPESVFGG